MSDQALKLIEVDMRLRYPAGRTKRLIRKGLIPAIQLPDGSLRVLESVVDNLLKRSAMPESQVAHAS
jgi:hypothetical protein